MQTSRKNTLDYMCNVSYTINVHALYNSADMEIIFNFFLCARNITLFYFIIVKIISTAALLYKVCTFVVQETFLNLIYSLPLYSKYLYTCIFINTIHSHKSINANICSQKNEKYTLAS
jgi:hypothetical protein